MYISDVCVHVCLLACFSVPWLQWVCPLIDHRTPDLWIFALFPPFSIRACPSLTALNIVSTPLVTHIHTHIHNGSITCSTIDLVWPSVERSAAILHKKSLHPPTELQSAQTNLLSKWFVSWPLFAAFPQIKRGDLIISWQINRRRPQKSGRELFPQDKLLMFTLEWMRALFYLTHFFPYIVMALLPKWEGGRWCVEVGSTLNSAHNTNCINVGSIQTQPGMDIDKPQPPNSTQYPI